MSKDLRGSGSVYQQKYADGRLSPIWWISYRIKGIRKDGSYGSILVRKSSGSAERKDAVKKLREEVANAMSGKPVLSISAEKLTLGSMLDSLLKRYAAEGKNGCYRMAKRAKLHLVGYFGEHTRAVSITSERLDEYKADRLQSFVTRLQDDAPGKRVRVRIHPASASINRELAVLRIAYNRAVVEPHALA